MAGMTTRVNLQADTPGSYAGLSAQFSGDGFSDMRFAADTMPADQFGQWVETLHREAPARLDKAAYADLAKPGVLVQPVSFGAVDPDLFEHVLSAAMHGQMTHPSHPPLNKESD